MANNKKHNELKAKNDKRKQVGLSSLIQDGLVKEEKTLKTILSKSIISENIVSEEKRHKERAEIIDKYYKRYISECSSFTNHGSIIEPKVMNRCCKLLYDAKNNRCRLEKQTLIILKTVILSVVRDTLHLIYIYSNHQSALRYLASELHDNTIEFDYDVFVDVAYSELFDVLRLKQNRGKKYG